MGVDRAQVAKWLDAATSRRARLSEKLAELTEARSRLDREVALLRELIGEEEAATVLPTQLVPTAGGLEFRQALNAVLATAGRPLHLSEIRSGLVERGVAVPGRGTDANIIAHLSRLPGVKRVDRGTYQIGPVSSIPKHKARRRKKRRSAKKTPKRDMSTRGGLST